MKKLYHNLIEKMWAKHEKTPLSANEVALYLFLLSLGCKSGWSMPIRLHNSEVCPLLMEKSALEKARKKLQDKGLITCTASRSPRHLPTYTIIGCEKGESTKKLPSKDERIIIEFLARMWQSFDERALNANEVTLFAYILHEAERNLWQMPVHIKDYMPLTLLLKQSALNDARNELAARSLITYDVGDGKRDVPKYALVGMDSIAFSLKASSSNGTSKHKPKSKKKADEPVEGTKTDVDTPIVTDMLPEGGVNTDEAQDIDVIDVNVYPTTEQASSVIDVADKDVSESDSDVSTNQPFYNANKPKDMSRGSFGMSIFDFNNETRDEYNF